MPERTCFFPISARHGRLDGQLRRTRKQEASLPDQLAKALLRYIDSQPGESPFATAVDGLAILRSDHPKPPTHMVSKPAMCIVAQGAKWAMFGEK